MPEPCQIYTTFGEDCPFKHEHQEKSGLEGFIEDGKSFIKREIESLARKELERAWEGFKQAGRRNAENLVKEMLRGGGGSPPRTQEAISKEGRRVAQEFAKRGAEREGWTLSGRSTLTFMQAALTIITIVALKKWGPTISGKGSPPVTAVEKRLTGPLGSQRNTSGFGSKNLRGRGGFFRLAGLDLDQLFSKGPLMQRKVVLADWELWFLSAQYNGGDTTNHWLH